MSTLAMPPTSRLSYRGKRNLVPLPYRNVSMQPYDDVFTEKALMAKLLSVVRHIGEPNSSSFTAERMR